METPTNQQFIILENSVMEKLKEKVVFCFWEKYDENHTGADYARIDNPPSAPGYFTFKTDNPPEPQGGVSEGE